VPGDRERRDVVAALQEVLTGVHPATVVVARALGANTTDAAALQHLLADGPLGPVELGGRLGLRSGSATAMVDRLVAAGHAERRAHPSDRRRMVVAPTERAAAEAARVLGPLLAEFAAASDGLSAEEQRVVATYLGRVADALRRCAAPDGGSGAAGVDGPTRDRTHRR
jgi:DNA-binding MarR family transcriptional regulator